MGEISTAFSAAFPANAPAKKRLARGLGATIEAGLASTGTGVLKYATIALRDAATGIDTGTIAYVYKNNGDADDAANGYYQKTGGGWEDAEWVSALFTLPDDVSERVDGALIELDTPDPSARLDSIVVTPTTPYEYDEAFGLTGIAQTFTTPGSITTNAVMVTRIPRGATTKKWAVINFVLRTHATDPANSSATLIAVASMRVDPEQDLLGPLYALWRDPVTDALKTVTQADLAARYGVGWQCVCADGTKATCGVQVATITGATKLTAYQILPGDTLRTSTWTAFIPDTTFAIAAVNLDDLVETETTAPTQGLKDELDAVAPFADLGRLRRFRAKAMQRLVGTAGVRLIHGAIGDSWSTSTVYYLSDYVTRMKALLGDGGVGFIGFGHSGGVMTLDAGGLYFLDSALTNWTSNYHSGSISPSISDARSSTAAASFKIANIASATHPALSDAKLYFVGTAAGVIKWRWNGGAWSADTNVQGGLGVQQSLTLTGLPTGALSAATIRTITLEIAVVSGSVILCGADFISASAGFVCHKFGSSGATSTDWATAAASGEWQAGIAALGLDTATVMLGTNDKAQPMTPTTFQTHYETIADGLQAAIPGVDMLFIAPPENEVIYTSQMRELARSMARAAKNAKAAYLNLQPAFGDSADAAQYSGTGDVLLMNSEHPYPLGAALIAGELERSMLWR